jgi:hypothetical protein
LTGSAYSTNVTVPATALTITAGEASVKTYSFVHPAGLPLEKTFCTNCGGTVFKKASMGFDGMVLVQGGTIDAADGSTVASIGKGPNGIGGCMLEITQPGVQIWVKTKADWVSIKGTGEGEKTAEFPEFAPGTI